MYFRCPACLAATWQDDDRPIEPAAVWSCGCCGKRLTPSPSPELGSTTADRFRAMLRTSRDLGVDAASAYSVLLGLLTIDELRVASSDLDRLREHEDDESDRASERPDVVVESASALAAPAGGTITSGLPASTGGTSTAPGILAKRVETAYDPAFRQAVIQGQLTVHEAVQRGDFEAYVGALISRYGLSRELACRVAENRVSVHQALAARRSQRQTAKPAPVPKRAVRRFASGIVVCVTLATLGIVSYWANARWDSSFPEPPRPKRERAQPRAVSTAMVDLARPEEAPSQRTAREITREKATEIRRDATGTVVAIEGPSPAAVLMAYCEDAAAAEGLEPLEITETAPRLVDARLGIFRDPRALDSLQAIWMRRDYRSRRWVAGDGMNPIPVRQAPELPLEARREPIGEGLPQVAEQLPASVVADASAEPSD